MILLSGLILMVSGTAQVGLKTMQTLSVVNNRKAMIYPTSMLIAAMQLVVICLVVKDTGTLLEGAILSVFWGAGGGTGCLISMYVEKKLKQRSEENA